MFQLGNLTPSLLAIKKVEEILIYACVSICDNCHDNADANSVKLFIKRY